MGSCERQLRRVKEPRKANKFLRTNCQEWTIPRRFIRKLAWRNMAPGTELQCKKAVQEGQVTKQGFRKIARNSKGNKSCYCRISRKSLNKEYVGWLLSGVGGLVTADTQKTEVPSAAIVLVFTNKVSQVSVISERVEGVEELPAVRVESGVT